jgi:hypothetical protein
LKDPDVEVVLGGADILVVFYDDQYKEQIFSKGSTAKAIVTK